MEVPKQLKNDIWDYCRANDITDIEGFTIKMIKDGFTVEKYGYKPNTPNKPKKKIVEEPVVEKPVVEEPVVIDVVEEVKKAEEEIEKKPEPIKPDLYGETPRGKFGSNLLD